MNTTIGFIGLGLMGKPMTRNLLRAGYPLVVHNRSRGAVDELTALGARPARSPQEVASQADVVITMLPNPEAVEQVIAGADGVFAAARRGLTVIDMSTSPPRLARELAVQAKALEMEMLDAPVSGGPIGAESATLTIMVGGESTAFERAQPILQALGSNVVHVGAAGMGQITKAVNQMLVGVTLAAVAEGFVLLQEAGVDRDAARRALLGGFASSRILDYHGARMLRRDFVAGSPVRSQIKDLRIANELAEEYHVATPMAQQAAQLFQQLGAQGGSDLDHSAVLQVLEQMVKA